MAFKCTWFGDLIMASILDVQQKLQDMIEPIVYPNGTGSPSIVNTDVKIVQGYPVKNTLDDYLRNGSIFISISSVEGMDKNTTRYTKRYHQINVPTPTVTVDIDNETNLITINGVAGNNQVCVVQTSVEVATHQAVDGESLNDIAEALGIQLTGAVVIGNTISVPGEPHIKGGTSVKATSAYEVKRQQKKFSVTIWAVNYDSLDVLGEAIDSYLSDIERFILPDDFYARIIYNGTLNLDSFQLHRLYKREIEYLIEYPTTRTEEFSTLVVTDLQIEDNRK